MASRDVGRGRETAEEIGEAAANPSVESIGVDVASQASVRRFAEDFMKRFDKLHVLVLCAGAYVAEREMTSEGIEKTWATNILGYYLPAVLLLERLVTSAPARIVVVASSVAAGLDLEDVAFDRRPYRAMAAYRQSKQADRMLTWALASRLRGRGVTANAMHPGYVQTNLIRDGLFGSLFRLGGKLVARSAERGADTAVWLAAARALAEDTGGYYVESQRAALRLPRRGASGGAMDALRAHDAMKRRSLGLLLVATALSCNPPPAHVRAGERLRFASVVRRGPLRGARGDTRDRQRAANGLRPRRRRICIAGGSSANRRGRNPWPRGRPVHRLPALLGPDLARAERARSLRPARTRAWVDVDPAPIALHAARITTPWDGASVSWAMQPAVEEVGLPVTRVQPGSGGLVRLDVRDLVQRWRRRSRDELGIAIVTDVASGEGMPFALTPADAVRDRADPILGTARQAAGPRLEVYVK